MGFLRNSSSQTPGEYDGFHLWANLKKCEKLKLLDILYSVISKHHKNTEFCLKPDVKKKMAAKDPTQPAP